MYQFFDETVSTDTDLFSSFREFSLLKTNLGRILQIKLLAFVFFSFLNLSNNGNSDRSPFLVRYLGVFRKFKVYSAPSEANASRGWRPQIFSFPTDVQDIAHHEELIKTKTGKMEKLSMTTCYESCNPYITLAMKRYWCDNVDTEVGLGLAVDTRAELYTYLAKISCMLSANWTKVRTCLILKRTSSQLAFLET